MQQVNFGIYDDLGDQIDVAIKRWSFTSRAEFFRYLAIDFLRKEAQVLPPEDVIKDYIKALNRVKSGQGLSLVPRERPITEGF